MKRSLLALLVLSMTATAAFAASDIGPKADVAAVRATAMRSAPGTTVLGVHVVGNYAFINWAQGEGSGGAAYKRVSGETWKRIVFEGGVTGLSNLTQAGIPAATARKLCSGWPKDLTPCGNF